MQWGRDKNVTAAAQGRQARSDPPQMQRQKKEGTGMYLQKKVGQPGMAAPPFVSTSQPRRSVITGLRDAPSGLVALLAGRGLHKQSRGLVCFPSTFAGPSSGRRVVVGWRA